MTYEVRLAEKKDMDWLVNTAGYNMICFEVSKPEWFNEDQFELLYSKGIEDKTCFVVTKGKELVGVLGGILVPNIFNSKYTNLTEILWYVLPEHRRSKCGYLLLKEYSKLSDTISGVSTFSILTDSSEVNIDTIEKFGFKLKEFSFYKEKQCL